MESLDDVCAICRQPLSSREMEICTADPHRFGGTRLCFEHQRRFSACAAVRGTMPGRR